MYENKNDSNKNKGFAGFEEFVSDINKDVESAPKDGLDTSIKDTPMQEPTVNQDNANKRKRPTSPSKSYGHSPVWYVDSSGEVFVCEKQINNEIRKYCARCGNNYPQHVETCLECDLELFI